MDTAKKVLYGGMLFWGARSFPLISMPLFLLHHDVSVSAIALSKSFQLIFFAVFSCFTSKFSDKYGSKISICISCLLETIYFCLVLKGDATLLIIAESINGIALGFYNGCFEKWLHDADEHCFPQNYSVYQKKKFMLMGVAVFIGGLGEFYSIAVSAVLCLGILIWFLTTQEMNVTKLDLYGNVIVNKISPKVKILFIAYLFINCGFIPVYSLWPAQLSLYKIDTFYPGWIYLIAMILQSFVCTMIARPRFSGQKARIKLTLLLTLLPLISVVALCLTMWANISMLLPVLSWVAIFTVLSMPTGGAIMLFLEVNKSLTNQRASFISFMDTCVKLTTGLLAFILSLGKNDVLFHTWLLSALLFFLTGLILVTLMLTGYCRATQLVNEVR